MSRHPFPAAARVAAVLAAAVLLAGCSSDDLSRTFGLTRDAPDEFTVTTRAPLSMPPDYSLRPPRPGAPRPQEQSQRTQAEAGAGAAAGAGRRGGAPTARARRRWCPQAGPAAPTDIRAQVDQDAQLDQPGQQLHRQADVLARAAGAGRRGRPDQGGPAPAAERGARARAWTTATRRSSSRSRRACWKASSNSGPGGCLPTRPHCGSRVPRDTRRVRACAGRTACIPLAL